MIEHRYKICLVYFQLSAVLALTLHHNTTGVEGIRQGRSATESPITKTQSTWAAIRMRMVPIGQLGDLKKKKKVLCLIFRKYF